MTAAGRRATLVILCVAWARTAMAAPIPAPRVAVTPAAVDDDPIVVEALSRLRFELADVGFAAPEPGATADFVVGLVRSKDRVNGKVIVSVTTTRPAKGALSVRWVELPGVPNSGADLASIIAIRSVEILRATILQPDTVAERREPPPKATVPKAGDHHADGSGAAVQLCGVHVPTLCREPIGGRLPVVSRRASGISGTSP